MDDAHSPASVGSLAARRPYDTPSEHGVTVQRCSVTITFPGRIPLRAAKFCVFDDRCHWYDAAGTLLLEHVFSRPVGDRFPWRKSVLHPTEYPVAFTKYQAEGSTTTIFTPRRETWFGTTPTYVFDEWAPYSIFQGAMCHAHFEAEFELASLQWKPSKLFRVKAEGSNKEFIKVWRHSSQHASRTVTIPLTYKNDDARHSEVRHFEIPWDALEVKPESNQLKLLPRGRRKSSGSGSIVESPPLPSKRRLSRIVRTWSIPSKLSPTPPSTPSTQETPVASQDPLVQFQEFTFRFNQPQDQSKFLQLFCPNRPSSINIGEPLWLSTPSTPSLEHRRTPSPQLDPIELPGPGVPEDEPAELQLNEYLVKGGPQVGSREPKENQYLNCREPFYKLLADSEIRLIRITGGEYNNDSAHLECSLEPYKLEDPPEYEALVRKLWMESYCWGTGPSTREITDGNLQGFRVSEHLWQALKRLRHQDPNRHRLIWTDKICINQSNVEEKNKQIALMRQIYARAIRTIIWIGETNSAKEPCPRVHPNDGETEPTLCTKAGESARMHANEHLQSTNLRGAIRHLQNKVTTKHGEVWWKRLWCVQEFHFTKNTPTVFFGPHALQWEHFCDKFDDMEDDSLALFKQLWFEKRQSKETSHSLFKLLSMTGDFKCSDRRDRVFALLGMADKAFADLDIVSPSVKVDYRSSIIRVLEEATHSLIMSEGTLDVLLDDRPRRFASDSPADDLPTWLPDFRSLQKPEIVKGVDNYYEAGPGTPQVKLVLAPFSRNDADSDLDDPRMLMIKALKFDVIQSRTRTDSDGLTQPRLPAYQQSPGGNLTYNSLMTRGHIVNWIMDSLDFDFEAHRTNARNMKLEPSPSIGRLMLDYLFEGKHSIQGEYNQRFAFPRRNILQVYGEQETQDLRYVQDHERSTEDVQYVTERWQHKRDRANKERLPVPRLAAALNDDDEGLRDTAQVDLDIARDVENLYLFARHSSTRYYLTVKDADNPSGSINFEAPMRKDALQATFFHQVRAHTSHSEEQAKKIEFHEYNAKHRKRDFFKTSQGFLGLGPSSLEEGDEIIIPQGSSRPWIVRSMGSHYVFVGDAVIPSIMSDTYFLMKSANVVDYMIR